jgi:hypothetical protein
MKRISVAAGFLAFTQIVPAAQADVRMYVRHEVADYAAWRQAYDAFDTDRRGLGVKGQAVYRSVDDGNDVTVWHDFATAEAAKTFAASPDLKSAMQKAGVKGAPQIWFVIQSEK